MTDDGKLRKTNDRGNRAKRLLENELLKEALEKMDAEIVEAWRNSGPGDDEKRHNAYLMNLLLQRFQEYLKGIVRDGDYAGKLLNEEVKE